MAFYTFSVDAVALVAATAKTVIELGSSATDRVEIVEYWYEFDAFVDAARVKCELGRFSAGVTTATTGTPQKRDPADGAASTVVKHTTTVEGAGTIEAGAPNHRLSPTGGLYVQVPLGSELVLAVSTFWRMRFTAPAGVNVTCGVTWKE